VINYELLTRSPRVLLEARLRPVQGDRFQPTGFADIGPAEYTRPDREGKRGERMLLVESAQSVANRLEKTCLDDDGPDINPELTGLPYIAATLTGATAEAIRTSSLIEPHRLASPYFLRTDFGEKLASEMAYTSKGPLNWKKIYAALFKYDPNCLIHGVFLSLLGDGRVRVPRAVTGFIEAENVKQAVSGGVKNSPVDPTGQIQVEAGRVEAGLYSNVPYARVEYVAEKIVAYFNLDTGLIRSYALGRESTELLIAIALLKLRRFLSTDLRLRTACNFEIDGDVKVVSPGEFSVPSETDLLSEAKRLISACKAKFADPAVTELSVKVVVKKKAEDEKRPAENNAVPVESEL
jgi:CRISPR-associated protein Csb1